MLECSAKGWVWCLGGQLSLERCQIAASIPGITLELLQECSRIKGLENLPACLLWHILEKNTQKKSLWVCSG